MGDIIAIFPGTQAAHLVAHWIEVEWPGIPIVDWLRQPLFEHKELPVVLGYLDPEGGELRACGAILLGDMEDRPNLNPWLGCLYVVPSARRSGIARYLVRALLEQAKAIFVPTLYLFCQPMLRPFYESEGWTVIEERIYEEKPCVVMERRKCEP